MADRVVEYDIIGRDKSDAGVKSAEDRLNKFNDNVKKQSRETGRKSGELLGGGIADGLAGFATKLGNTAAAVGLKGGAALGESIAGGITKASPAITAAVVGVGIAAATVVAPTIGATVAGAVLGGLGVGGIIGGLLALQGDPRVVAAGTYLADSLKKGLAAEAEPMVLPILAAVKKIESAFQAIRPTLNSIFERSAGFIEPLVNAALSAVGRIATGIDKALGASGPTIDAIAHSFQMFGFAVEVGLGMLSDSGPAAGMAIRDLGILVAGATLFVFAMVDSLTELYGWLKVAAAAMRGNWGEAAVLAAQLKNGSSRADEFARKLAEMSSSAQRGTGAMGSLKGAVNGVPNNKSVTVTTPGSSAAIGQMQTLNNQIRAIDRVVDVAIRVTQTGASRSAVAAALNKQNFADGSTWAASARHAEQFAMNQQWANGTSGTSRTGGPTKVDVNSNVNVQLDGKPFYDMTASAVSVQAKRTKHWEKVGKR